MITQMSLSRSYFGRQSSPKVVHRCSRLTNNKQRRQYKIQARTREAGVGVFGTKAGMTTIFLENGDACAVTVISVQEKSYITQILTQEKDGYSAVQIGYKKVDSKKGQPSQYRRISKPEVGHCEKAGLEFGLRHLREFKLKDPAQLEEYELGQELNGGEMFQEGDLVDIAGTSTGKGFQGTIKKYHHARGNMTHGSKSKREHGSTGAATYPGRVLPGVKMAGQMGNKRVKVKKVKVMMVDPEAGAIVVKGQVPGKPGGLLEIAPAKIIGKNI
eukprot:TRINITY_DN6555_c1_g1_i1.p2 TRINITY_DN6555_c1_g1~~TRINITY_DN6555_c1_g1_i1.p2  ORF type:complete len:284 (-),score=29.17 TRINITY_DN6555_c1_g1_i1:162-977(-)